VIPPLLSPLRKSQTTALLIASMFMFITRKQDSTSVWYDEAGTVNCVSEKLAWGLNTG